MPLTAWKHEHFMSGTDGMVYKLAVLVPAFAYGVLRNVFRRKPSCAPELGLTVVAIIKNEGAYIKEWIEYHRLVGVERFYLYDNQSDDNTLDLLAPYVRQGVVVLERMAGEARQMDAYNDALRHHGRACKYMAFIDADEFIAVGDEPLLRCLDNKLTGRAGGLALNWLIFGSGGQTHRDEGLVIERFTQRAPYSHHKNLHVKEICRPQTVLGVYNPHFCHYLWGYHAIDVWGRPVAGAYTQELPAEPFPRLHHYFTKSLEEFRAKRLRGCADDHEDRPMDDFYEHDCNDETDTTLAEYAPQVRAACA